MSTLFCCQPHDPHVGSRLGLTPLGAVRLNQAYLQALEGWGVPPRGCFVLERLGDQTLDDRIMEALDDELAQERLCAELLVIVRECSVAALWYAGFWDELPVLGSPEAFVHTIRLSLLRRDLEPAARLVRPGKT